MLLLELFDAGDLDNEIAQGFVSRQTHPTEPLAILNYSRLAQVCNRWNQVTMTCRGLIYNTESLEIVGRGLPKFLNAGQHDTLPNERFVAWTKWDGSAIITTRRPSDGATIMATRGSFTSTQAVEAQRIWDERYADVEIPDGWSLFMELITPSNRVVVDYGDMDDLVLLCAVRHHTGEDVLPGSFGLGWPGPSASSARARSIEDLVRIVNQTPGDVAEGLVVRFDSGLRVKVKSDDYVRLHRILTGLNERRVFECVALDHLRSSGLPAKTIAQALGLPPGDVEAELKADGSTLTRLLDGVPDEFDQWVRTQRDDLHGRYADMLAEALSLHASLCVASRKDAAAKLDGHALRGSVFGLLDGRPIDHLIWRILRPTSSRATFSAP